MDEWLDIAWLKIIDGLDRLAASLNHILAPLNQHLGPALVIFMLVVGLVALTIFLGRIYNTRRYAELQSN